MLIRLTKSSLWGSPDSPYLPALFPAIIPPATPRMRGWGTQSCLILDLRELRAPRESWPGQSPWRDPIWKQTAASILPQLPRTAQRCLQGTRNHRSPWRQPTAGSAYGNQPQLHGNSEGGENIMCISTNYSRKGKQPEGPEIACVLLFCILKGRANLEEIGSHFIQSQPKWHVSLPRAAVRLCGCRQSPCLLLWAEKVWLAEPGRGCPTLGGRFQLPGAKSGQEDPQRSTNWPPDLS